MDTTGIAEFLLLVFAIVAAILGPAKLKALRKELNDIFDKADELRGFLDMAEHEIVELEGALMESDAIIDDYDQRANNAGVIDGPDDGF